MSDIVVPINLEIFARLANCHLLGRPTPKLYVLVHVAEHNNVTVPETHYTFLEFVVLVAKHLCYKKQRLLANTFFDLAFNPSLCPRQSIRSHLKRAINNTVLGKGDYERWLLDQLKRFPKKSRKYHDS